MSDAGSEYSGYLQRFSRLVGEIQTGQYGHYKDRLVRKLNEEQFGGKLSEYARVGDQLCAAVQNGDTIDERLTVQIRALEFDLIMEVSRYLP